MGMRYDPVVYRVVFLIVILIMHLVCILWTCAKFHVLLNIAGVHDSFWTHACNVDVMNQILREKFVELYSMPILENVSISNTHCFYHL